MLSGFSHHGQVEGTFMSQVLMPSEDLLLFKFINRTEPYACVTIVLSLARGAENEVAATCNMEQPCSSMAIERDKVYEIRHAQWTL